mmetsp:Transcript_122592/g.199366  ORF Transcript_122592/g.199366 Transcript_122592/m.199366 type:complete len:127 (+) Transcript_122592:326-706(+)
MLDIITPELCISERGPGLEKDPDRDPTGLLKGDSCILPEPGLGAEPGLRAEPGLDEEFSCSKSSNPTGLPGRGGLSSAENGLKPSYPVNMLPGLEHPAAALDYETNAACARSGLCSSGKRLGAKVT